MFRLDSKIVLVTNEYVLVSLDQMELTCECPSLNVESVVLGDHAYEA